MIKGGNARLALAHIHLSRCLKAMRLNENNRILLTFEGGEQKECDKIVLALPGSVYKEIEIDPQLISPKELAFIHKIPYGNNIKILLPVKYDKLSYNSTLTDEMVAFMGQNDNVCTLYCAGNAGRTLKNNMKALYTRALIALSTVNPSVTYSPGLPEAVNDSLQLGNYKGPVTHFWVDDPYARGSYSYRSPDIMIEGSSIKDYKEENVRVPYAPLYNRIFFAGEYTTIEADLGTMEGAIESGEHAARMILIS